jgi:beta-glucanase (GH16 family)
VLFLTGCGGASDSVPEGEFNPPVVEYVTVFEDNFDGASIDTSRWNVITGDGCPELCGFGNNEEQIYSADNVSLADGVLRIEGRREADSSFSSAKLDTNGKFDFRYGRIEVSAKLPGGQGIWPAIWLYHSDPTVYGPWPLSGEIDIVEGFNLGVNGNTAVRSTTHYGLPTLPFNGTGSAFDDGTDPTQGFREYAVEWERDKIRFFVDGVHFQTQTSDDWYTYFPADEEGFYDPLGAFKTGPRDAPFDQMYHLILNLAIGGNPVGSPDGTTAFPQVMEIDYVRVMECVNANPDTGRGCGSGDVNIVPLEDNDGGPLADVETAQPYIERLDLYEDAPAVLTLSAGGVESSNTLVPDGFTGDGATVVSDPLFQDPDDAENTVWRVEISGATSNVYLGSEVFDDESSVLKTGFNFSDNRLGGEGGDGVGELAFDMKVNSLSDGANIVIKIDSGFPNVGEFTLPTDEIAVGEWKTYSVKFSDLVANPGFVDCCGGTGVDLAAVINPFVLEVQGGSADLYLDDIYVTNACKVVGACGVDLQSNVPNLNVFIDTVNQSAWATGIAASDSGSGFSDYTATSDPANKVNWEILADDDTARGDVVEVRFNDSSAFGVWFVKSPTPVNMSAYSAGALVFDLNVSDYGNNTTGMTMKVDCSFPCTSGDQNLGVIADGVWEEITVPVSRLVAGGLDLAAVNTGIVLFPTAQSGDITFRVDNIRWVAETEAPPLDQIDLPLSFEGDTTAFGLTDFGGASSSLVADPLDADNTVAQTVKSSTAETFAGTVMGNGSGFANPIPFTADGTTMTVRVYSPAAGIPVLLKVENADASVFSEVIVNTTVANAWETLTFDFSTASIDTSATFVQAIIFFNFNNAGADRTYFWDDVTFGAAVTPTSGGADFEPAGAPYTFGDFGGGAVTVIANPQITGINTSATVGQMQKFAGEVFGGSTLTLPGEVDFSNSSVFTMKVFAQRAVPVLFKLEGLNVERSVTHTGSGWEELSFDFAGDTGPGVTQVTLIFDLGVNGDAGGDPDNWTFLFDDIVTPIGSGGTGGDGGDDSAFSATDFEPAGAPYTFGDFGGGVVTVIDNSQSSGINTSATVGQMQKFAGEVFGGSTLTLNGEVDFSDSSTFTMKVFASRSVPVLFKLEGLNVERSVTHTGSGWEELSFDFAGDTGAGVTQITLIFDLGVNGDAGGDADNWTFLFDDIALGAAAPVAFTATDFEPAGAPYTFGDFGGGVVTVIDNSQSAGINTSATVGQMQKFAGEVFGGSTLTLNGEVDFSDSSTFTMKVFASRSVPVLFKLEGLNVERSVTHTGSGWEELSFDFAGDTGAGVTQITLIFDLGVNGDAGGDADNWTFLFDDIALSSAADEAGAGDGAGASAGNVTFDDDAVLYTFTDFGDDTVTLLGADPTPVTNVVAVTTKGVGAATFAGTTVGGSSFVYPLTATDSQITVRVYVPDVGTPVRLKLEDATDPTKSVEAQVVTSLANEWETLTFDFNVQAEGTAALNPSYTFDKVSIFFNFGTDGATAGEKTYFWDDITFIGGSGNGSPTGAAPAFSTTDFEPAGAPYTFGDFGGGAVTVIDNPQSAGINTSATVAQMQKFAGEVFGGSTLTLNGEVDFSEGSTFTMKVFASRSVEVLFKLEGLNVERSVTHAGSGWEELSFDFAGDTGADVTKISLFFDLGTVGDAGGDADNWTFLFDDIALGAAAAEAPSAFATTDFEPSETFANFEGGVATVIDNPQIVGINTSATVGQMQKFAGATFGGSTLTLNGEVDFSASSAFTMKVFASRSVDVLFKLEGLNVERTVTHAGSGWEELSFDFDGDTGAGVTKITLIFDNGTVGDAAGDADNWTFYFDDIALSVAPLEPAAGAFSATDFEPAETFANFEGGVATVIDNPQVVGINTSARVGQMQKFAGATFGGSTLTLNGEVDFSASSTFTMKVFASRSVDVLFKLEGLNVERTVTHAGSGWEELSFDFDGDTGAGVTKITFIFDNGTAGDAAGDADNWTFYFDDIALTGGGS